MLLEEVRALLYQSQIAMNVCGNLNVGKEFIQITTKKGKQKFSRISRTRDYQE